MKWRSKQEKEDCNKEEKGNVNGKNDSWKGWGREKEVEKGEKNYRNKGREIEKWRGNDSWKDWKGEESGKGERPAEREGEGKGNEE